MEILKAPFFNMYVFQNFFSIYLALTRFVTNDNYLLQYGTSNRIMLERCWQRLTSTSV